MSATFPSTHAEARSPFSVMRKALKGAFVCLVWSAMAAPVAAEQEQEQTPNYKLRDPASLDRFHALTRGSPIPLNKSYADLSPSQRAVLHKSWENIPPGDEPPFPLNGMKRIHEALARAQEALQVEGQLYLIASINAAGEVTEVKAIGSPSPEMTKYAAAVLFDTKFKPGVCGGKACAMQYPLDFLFKLD